MKNLILLLTVFCALACSSTSVDHTETTARVNSEDLFSVQSAVRSKFLLQVRRVANEGDLFDPQSIAPMLEMQLHTVKETLKHTVRDCGDGSMTWAEVTHVKASDPTWYHSLPSGAGQLDIPAFTINPASKTGTPEFHYEINHTVACRDWPRIQDHTSASLVFDNLPAFSCVTPASITAEIPEAQFLHGTDGIAATTVAGRIDDEVAVRHRESPCDGI